MTDRLMELLRDLPPDLPEPGDRMTQVRRRVRTRTQIRLASAVCAVAGLVAAGVLVGTSIGGGDADKLVTEPTSSISSSPAVTSASISKLQGADSVTVSPDPVRAGQRTHFVVTGTAVGGSVLQVITNCVSGDGTCSNIDASCALPQAPAVLEVQPFRVEFNVRYDRPGSYPGGLTLGTICREGGEQHHQVSFTVDVTEPAEGAETETYVSADCGASLQIEPREMVHFCGDAGAFISGLQWQSWTRERAIADAGRVSVKGSYPSEGRIIRHARVVVYRPVLLSDGTRLFSCMTITPGFTDDSADTVPLYTDLDGFGHPRLVGKLRPCEPRD